MTELSICIVNYRTDRELARCLTSIRTHIADLRDELIIIDNSRRNRWYSGGNNRAAARATGKYLLFLNPDCYFKEDSLTPLVRWMDHHPHVGACEPRQVYDNGRIAPTGSLQPKWWIDLFELTGLSKWAPHYAYLLPWSTSTRRKSASAGFGRTSGFFQRKNPGPSEEDWGIFAGMLRYRMVDKDRQENWQTEVVSGAALLVRQEAWKSIRGFDERLKLYYTDVDLCRRIKRAGWEIWHAGEFRIFHSTRRSTGQLPWDQVYGVYARDAMRYYSLWGEKFGGALLFMAMKCHQQFVTIGKRVRAMRRGFRKPSGREAA